MFGVEPMICVILENSIRRDIRPEVSVTPGKNVIDSIALVNRVIKGRVCKQKHRQFKQNFYLSYFLKHTCSN